MILRSEKYIGNIVDLENNNEARNPSLRFLISSRAQEPAITKTFDTINHYDKTFESPSPVPSILTELRQRKGSDKKKHQKQSNLNNMVANMIPMSEKKEYKNDRKQVGDPK